MHVDHALHRKDQVCQRDQRQCTIQQSTDQRSNQGNHADDEGEKIAGQHEDEETAAEYQTLRGVKLRVCVVGLHGEPDTGKN